MVTESRDLRRPAELAGSVAGVFQAAMHGGSSNLMSVVPRAHDGAPRWSAQTPQGPAASYDLRAIYWLGDETSRATGGAEADRLQASLTAYLVGRARRSGPSTPAAAPLQGAGEGHEPFDVVAMARSAEGQATRAKMLAARLERAVDALVECKLRGREDDPAALRDVLFDLYEAGILLRDQVSHRGRLDPADFYEELRAYRLRRVER